MNKRFILRLGLPVAFLVILFGVGTVWVEIESPSRFPLPSPVLSQSFYPRTITKQALSAWRREAERRIDSLRKANIVVHVQNPIRQSISGATVSLSMKRHQFIFGTAVSAQLLTDTSSDGERYRKLVKRLFNKVVLENDLKWGPWLANTPRYNRKQTMQALRWLKAHELPVRGHYLAWGYIRDRDPVRFNPEAPELYRDALFAHIREKLQTVGDLVVEWDVINHIVTQRNYNLAQIYGRGIWVDLLNLASELAPAQRRFVNEGRILINHPQNRREAYYEAIDFLLKQGAPLDGIGMMGHFTTATLMDPPGLWQIFDTFGSFGLPILITEFDVRFGKQGERYALSKEEERLQADYTRDFLTAAFSHPAVEGVLLWGFWEGRHWYPSAALFRQDWSIKPNGRVWEDLISRVWWTDTTGTTDSLGQFRVRGFKGDYTLTVNDGQNTYRTDFSVTEPSVVVSVILPATR